MKYGTQPDPPSDRAIFRPGYRLGTVDHKRSEAAIDVFMGCMWIITSIGASGALTTICPDDPRWMDSTVPQSTRASHSGFQ